MNSKQTLDIINAGEISKKIKEYARAIAKKDVPLLEIAEKIENKIYELGAKPAFPTNLSINEIAAHYTPLYNDETKACGLLKIDIGVQINGWLADTAFSVDLENSELNKKLIEASKLALTNVEKIINKNSTLSEIGKTIENSINSKGFNPIVNLSGHSMEKEKLHAGITIPNVNNNSNIKLETGLFAVEPFATNGSGKIHDGKPSGIYELSNLKNSRSPLSREILDYVVEEYSTLPFCSRWLIKKFGTKALIGLKQLENEGILFQFSQLVEVSKGIVSQAENTFLIEKDKVTITTKED
ncbi:MAG: type II methionyl aminopeptidase [Candidatus Pacearchaeota archaeon]|jgi:methionyl aminopeptidase